METFKDIIETGVPSLSFCTLGVYILMKIKNRDENKLLRYVGWFALFFGLITTALIITFQIQKSFPDELTSFFRIISPIFSIEGIGIGSLILLAVFVYKEILRLINIRSYKLNFYPILDNDEDVIISITSESKEKIRCFAKLEELFIDDIKRDVNGVNPESNLVKWDNNVVNPLYKIVLEPNIPKTMWIAEDAGDGKFFVNFSDDEITVLKKCTVKFGFYRESGEINVRFSEFKGTFFKNNNGIFEWN